MSEDERQKVVRIPGSRRAKLTPAPGSDPEPEAQPAAEEQDAAASAPLTRKGPNDDRLRQDVPPHY